MSGARREPNLKPPLVRKRSTTSKASSLVPPKSEPKAKARKNVLEKRTQREDLFTPQPRVPVKFRPDGRRPLESSPKSIREKATVPFGELNQRCDLRGGTRQQRTEEEEGQTLSSDGRCCHGEFGPVPLGEERSWSENPQDVSGRAERVSRNLQCQEA